MGWEEKYTGKKPRYTKKNKTEVDEITKCEAEREYMEEGKQINGEE